MKTITRTLTRKLVLTLLMMLSVVSFSQAQKVFEMSVENCSATANEIQFDVFVKNIHATNSYQYNSFVFRITLPATMIPSTGTNTISWGYLSGSDVPLSFPGTGGPTFTYTAATRLLSLSTGTGVYNNTGCPTSQTAINMNPGAKIKLGRFYLQNSTQGFVPGTHASATWNTTSAMVMYTNCSAGTASFTGSSTTGTQLITPICQWTIPSGCNVVATPGPVSNVQCNGGNDGSAQITLSGDGVTPGGTYSINGGPAIPFTGNPFTINGLTAGNYSVVVTTETPCTSSPALFTIAEPGPSSSTETITACDSYTWAVDGQTYNTSGNYQFIGTLGGCPHTYNLNLTIIPSTTNSTSITACDSYTWSENGQTYNVSGTYTNVVGCHTEELVLTIVPSTFNSTSITACDSYTWSENGQTYNVSGTYTNTVGCHTEELVLTIIPSTFNSTSITACDSYTWSENGQTYSVSGTYTNTFGCHTEELVLTIVPSTFNSTSITACDSYTWSENGQTYNVSGTYTNTVGCHTEELVLTIIPSTTNSTSITACDSYTWSENGQTYNVSGTYTNVVGCHTEELVLTIVPTTFNSTSITACDSYTWSENGQTYSVSGTYTNVVGCHTEELVLTIIPSTTNSTSITACDSYTWSENGQTYNVSGTYTNVVGCHTEELVLTIVPSTFNSTSITACDSYTWSENGQTYNVSGTYTNVVGCHTEELVLTIIPSTFNSSSITACDSYTWSENGQTYSVSGTYTNTVNCHTEELVLTIIPSTINSTSITACDSYTWSENGQTYNVSGTYTNVVGCHTEELVLTIVPSTFNSTSITACDSYTWSENGQTYNVSGTYTNVTGCHTEELVLTIIPSTFNSTSITACDSYTWSENGQTYNVSGTYTNTVGCHTEELVLTIVPSTFNSTSITACDSYTWSENGQTYNASGTYTNVVGCHTEELVLTIIPSTSNTTTISACGTYTWSENGQTYTASGIYTNTVGCHTEILDLTINPSDLVATASEDAPIACFGGMTTVTVSASGGTAPYTGTGTFSQAAGTVTYVVSDDGGCSTAFSLTLTEPSKVEGFVTTTDANCGVDDGTATVAAIGGTPGYTYLWNDAGSQTTATATGLAAGTYMVTITDANGCTGTATGTVSGVGGQPSAAGPISGPAGACRNTSGIVYSLAPVSGATSYIWSLPAGASGSSSTNSITVAFDNSYSGGFICVTPVNTCGSGLNSCINVPVFTVRPAQPGFIVGPAYPCGPATYTYSIPPSANAQNYTWNVSGAGLTILSGQGTNMVQIQVAAGFGQGVISVNASNCIGTTSTRYMAVTGIPSHSNSLVGPGIVCANTSGVAYSIGSVNGAQTYSWSTTGDISVVSQAAGSVIVDFGPGFTSGQLIITTTSPCGSFSRGFTINSVPGQPGGISGQGSNLCNATGVVYSIAAVAGATSYSWTVPAGATIVGSSTGQSVTVDFGPSFSSGNICVQAVNACGNSVARCWNVIAVPATPGAISGSSSVCKSASGVVYSVAPVAGATGYIWSISGGASIAPAGTSATVNFNSATSTSATITMNAVNACGFSSPSKKTIAVNLGCRTAEDMSPVSLSVYPNPTAGKVTASFNAEVAARYTLKVVDLLGNTVYQSDIAATEGLNTQDLDMTKVAKGMYLMSIRKDGAEAQTLRLIVE